MNFLTNINLNGNKLEGAIIENAVIQNVGVDPSSLKKVKFGIILLLIN